jgi:hypothetical protein
MDDQQRIERLEYVLGTLITWLHGTLGSDAVRDLVDMLVSPTDASKQEHPQ